jgi:TPR repeat protein
MLNKVYSPAGTLQPWQAASFDWLKQRKHMRLISTTMILGLAVGLTGCGVVPERTGTLAATGDYVGERVSGLLERLNSNERAREEEVQRLFNQPLIDPLSAYLDSKPNDLRYIPHRQRVARERDRRCEAIGTRYDQRPATRDNLEQLRSLYNRSCPLQVSRFEQRLANTPDVELAATPKAPEPAAPRPAPRARPEPPPAPVAEAQPAPAPVIEEPVMASAEPARNVESEEAKNCYLLFAIRNFQQAHRACIAAARHGDAKAQHHIASLARTSGEADAAYHWATRSAEQQHAPGLLLLAELYQKGEGTAVNQARAVELLRAAADQGSAQARYQVGLAYLRGEGVTRDSAQAAAYLEQAAEQNHVPALLALAELHQSQSPPDPRAREWLRRAASQDSAEAQYALGVSYTEAGAGGVDNLEAYVWLSRAVLNGYERARSYLEMVAPQLTPEQLELAQRRVQSSMSGRRS